MYEILRRSPEQPWARPELASPAMLDASPAGGAIVLRLRENRSHLTEPARQCFAVLVAAMMALAILPALEGYWMVPAYCLATMAALTFALERHAKSKPKCESLEFAEGRIRHRDDGGLATELPVLFTRLHADEATRTSLRLFLKHRDRSVEICRCLGLVERRAMMPVIAAALSQTREARR